MGETTGLCLWGFFGTAKMKWMSETTRVYSSGFPGPTKTPEFWVSLFTFDFRTGRGCLGVALHPWHYRQSLSLICWLPGGVVTFS